MKKTSPKQKKTNVHHCVFCEKTIVGNSYKFRAHLYGHKQVEPRFNCQHCPKQFYRSDEYNCHAITHSKERRAYICDTCGRSFLNKANLIKHIQAHHAKTPGSKCKTYRCGVCQVKYCENRLLLWHIRRTHFNLGGKQTSHSAKLLNETWVERVLRSDVYVEMTKLTPNVIAIRKLTQNVQEPPTATDEGSASKENRARIKSKVRDEPSTAKEEGRDSKEGKDRIKCKVRDKDEVEDKGKKRAFFEDSTDYYSKAVCNYCGKEMLKKSLVGHIRERHMKVKRFSCKKCGGHFNRRYQMVQHSCKWHERRAKRSRRSNSILAG
ncbi:unnamed protein product, partial [Iphiclides podalirius]